MKKIQLSVGYESKPEKPIEVSAYLFDRRGTLLTTAPLKEGQATLEVDEQQLRGARIIFAPRQLQERRKVTPEYLARQQSYEPAFKFEPGKARYEFLPIPDYLSKYWLWCVCRVRGRVVRPVSIGGISYDMPVCNARVHICEVDRLWLVIPRLPDDLIRRLRDELLKVIELPHPIPLPDPPPFKFDSGVVDPSPINLALMNKAQTLRSPLGNFDVGSVSLNPQPEPPSPLLTASRLSNAGSDVMFNPQPDPPGTPISAISLETRVALNSNSISLLRRSLLDNIALIRPWICLWDWLWPYFYDCDEVAVLTTDHQGRFDTSIWYFCLGDHPDLYFWIEYSIGGTWTTVYAPGVRCHTYWDYVCGSEVTIRVTDPRVPWCGDDQTLPGKQVAILSIGNAIGMTEIQRHAAGTSEGLTTTTFSASDFAAPTGDGTISLDTPMGGVLDPHVFFGDGLIPAGITHYQWSYRRLGSSGDWTPLDTPVIRHYAEEQSDGTLTFKPYPLGPDPAYPGEILFKIRPLDPPIPSGSVVSTSWAPEVDARQNTASAFFPTHLLDSGNATTAAGKYELKLEFFKTTGGSANVADLTTEGVTLKTPTIPAPYGPGTVPTQTVAHFPASLSDQEDRVIRNGSGHIVAFRLVVHIDNNVCSSEIKDVSVNGQAAGPCGFIGYTPGSDAVVSFVAAHPNNFATFGFGVYKGSCGQVTPSTAAGWVGRAVVNGFTRAGTQFTKNIPVTSLLSGGSCGTVCIKAAFSENLYVTALATDGWSRLSYLDAPATPKAFALEPVS